MTLDELNLEEPARVSEVGGQGALRRRLLDMGITPGTEVMIRKRAPMYIIMEYRGSLNFLYLE